MSEAESTPDLLAKIEDEQVGLRVALAGWEPSLLALRPPSGKWSVLENIRHMLFAEQAHLGGFGTGGLAWSTYGYTPETMRLQRKLPPLDGDSAAFSVQEVFGAWEAVHADLRRSLQTDTPEVQKALKLNLRHLRGHIEVIERLLRGYAKSTSQS